MPSTSWTAVHTGIATYFGGTTYDSQFRIYRGAGPLVGNGLSGVRLFEPKRLDQHDFLYGLPSGRNAGAYMIVEFPEATEVRSARAGATGGEKVIRYTVILHIFHQAWLQHSEDAGADVDLLHEAILDRIRADRTLGGCVVQAGESQAGIRSVRPMPELEADVTKTYFQISFEADQYIIA